MYIKYNKKVTFMKHFEDFSLVYITDLDNKNYLMHIEEMRENLKRIIRASSFSIAKMSTLIGITRLTLKRFIVDDNNLISFITANKFNNFVRMIHEEYNNSTLESITTKKELV